MNELNIKVTEATCLNTPLFIGIEGENNVTKVNIDYSEWVDEFGDGSLSLEIMRAGDTVPYIAPLTQEEDGKAIWMVSNVDTGARGEGAAGFVFTVSEQVKKSAVIRIFVGRDVGGTPGERPDPYEGLITYIEELLAQTEENAAAAASSATGAAGSATTASQQAQAAAAARAAAQAAQQAAETAKGAAETAQQTAETARDAAASSATGAAGSATTAAQQAQAATTARAAAETAQQAAETAKGAAETAQQAAETAQDAAASSATGAAGSATTASQQAQAAAAARAAAQAAQQAAETAKGAAETAQQTAETARDAAASSATGAAGSATTAAQQAQAATTARAAAETAQQAAETAKGAAETAQQAAEAAQQAIENMTVSAETIDASSPTVEKQTDEQTGTVNLNFRFPKNQATTSATVGPAPIVTFDASAADMPLKQVVVNIEPVQAGSGEPSPDNVRPISGWTGSKVTHYGANLLDGVSINRGVYVAASGREQTSATGFSSTDYVPISDDVSILTNFTSQLTSAISVAYYDASKVFISRQFVYGNDGQLPPVGPASEKLILPADAEWLRVNCYYNEFAHVAISDRDIDNINIPFPDSAGTVYGGTLTINADGSGEMVVDSVRRQINTIDWSSTSYYFYSGVLNDLYVPDAAGVPFGGACEVLTAIPSATNGQWQTSVPELSIGIRLGASRLNIKASTYATVADLLAAIGNYYVVYRTTNTTRYQLTAEQITTLLGTNNIWADCGDVTVTYGAYLETLKASLDRTNGDLDTLRACIAPIEDGATASQAYAAGAYFFRNGSFCTALTAISVGAAFTLGTNYQATTVAAALIALQS